MSTRTTRPAGVTRRTTRARGAPSGTKEREAWPTKACGSPRHCSKCDPYGKERLRELLGLERGTRLTRLRPWLLRRIRLAAFTDVHHRTTHRLSRSYRDLSNELGRTQKQARSAIRYLCEAVRQSKLVDEPNALLWLQELQQTIDAQLGHRISAAKKVADRYRQLSGLPRDILWTTRIAAITEKYIKLAARKQPKGLNKRELARYYVALLLVEAGVFSRLRKPSESTIGKMLGERLRRKKPVSKSDPEMLLEMIRASYAKERLIADGDLIADEGLVAATSPGVSLQWKWRPVGRARMKTRAEKKEAARRGRVEPPEPE